MPGGCWAPGQKGRVSMRQRINPYIRRPEGPLVAVSGVPAWPPAKGRLARPRQRIAELGWRLSRGLRLKGIRWLQAVETARWRLVAAEQLTGPQ